MTSRLDEEELHPLVSSLLEGRLLPTTTTANVPTKSYTREQMMTLRTTKLSMTRPDNLSVEFNGDDGKFSPFKWLEYRWEIEGIKNRPSSKKIDSLCAGADDNTGLSPQRRAFSSGCRAPDGEKSREGGHEKDIIDRLGGHGKNWRNGSTGGSEKYGAKGAAGHYQKPGYGQQQRSEWKRNDKDTRATNNRFGNPRRDERAGSVSGSEKLPEWADGPTTMDDMIELRGFDEPKKGKKKKEQKKEKPVAVPEVNPLSASGSRPPSTDLSNHKGNVETIEDSAIQSAETAYSTTSTAALPETDHELAALLGVLDTNVTKPKRESPEDTAPMGGSRLSRFFKKPADPSSSSEGAANDENVANPMLAKLLGQTPSTGGQTPSNGVNSVGLSNLKGGIRLEDIEKTLPNNDAMRNGNPLQDPSQQAEFLKNLQKLANKQQEQQPRHPSPPTMNGGTQVPQHQMHMQQQNMPNVPLVADPALLASFAQNPNLLASHVENQLHQAIAAAMRANNGQPIPAQLQHQLKMAAMRNKVFLQQQTVAFAHFTHNMQQQHQQAPSKARAAGPSMIPASVQRQLHKTASNAADKRDKPSSSSPSDEQQQQGVSNENDVAMHMKKLQMQHNYSQMVSAMNNGLGMAAWRPNQPGMPQNVQMLLAQQHAAAHQAQQMRMMMGKQHQDLMMNKLMQMQAMAQQQQQAHQQQQQAQHHQQHAHNLAPGAERAAQHMSGDINQVGPMQTPLEKLLASVGVEASQFTGSAPQEASRIPSSARPMTLEDIEKELTATAAQK